MRNSQAVRRLRKKFICALHLKLFTKPSVLGFIAVCLMLFASTLTQAQKEITERHYIKQNIENHHGSTPVKGHRYTISRLAQGTPSQVTFAMNKDQSLFIKFEALKKPAGVLLMGTGRVSHAIFDAVWANDDIRRPVIIRTRDFWIPVSKCDATGCPKIRFMSTRGTVALTVVEKTSSPVK